MKGYGSGYEVFWEGVRNLLQVDLRNGHIECYLLPLSCLGCLEGKMASGSSFSVNLLHDWPTCLSPLESWSP